MFPGRHQIVPAMTDEHANVQLLAGADRQACFHSLKEQTVSILAAHLDEDLNRL